MDKKTLNVNIISSCVCRDSFELGDKHTKHNSYSIEFFYQATNAFSLYSKPLPELLELNEGDLTFGSPWQRRIFLTDIRKDIFQKIGEAKRDNYLILEFTDFAKNLYRLKSNEDSYLVQTDPSKNNEAVFSKYIEKIISPWTLPREYIDSCLKKYVDDILKIYDVDKIIICEIYHTGEYITIDNAIKKFKAPVQAYNNFLKKCYSYIENEISQRVGKAHIIKMPENALGNEAHKWGKYTLHFTKELYEYLFSAIDIVCCGYHRSDEEKALACLREECEHRYNSIRENSAFIEQLDEETQKRQTLEKEKIALVEKVRHLEKEKNKLEKEKQQLVSEIDKIKMSKSYKIGRVVTFIPRILFRRKSK